MQQCQVEEQLLELARNHHELQDMRDEVDSRDARIERLQKDLQRYQLQMQAAAKASLPVKGGVSDELCPTRR